MNVEDGIFDWTSLGRASPLLYVSLVESTCCRDNRFALFGCHGGCLVMFCTFTSLCCCVFLETSLEFLSCVVSSLLDTLPVVSSCDLPEIDGSWTSLPWGLSSVADGDKDLSTSAVAVALCAIIFCRTSRIFSCRMFLLGNTSECCVWNAAVAWPKIEKKHNCQFSSHKWFLPPTRWLCFQPC